MALSDFLRTTHLFLFIHDILYVHIRQHKKILCCTKNYCVNRKNISHKVNVTQQNYVSHKKICCGNKKNYVTPKKGSCWLNMFSVAQKRQTFFQKLVPVAYMLNWLKKFCVARKILWCRTKIKDGVHKCYWFYQNGAP